MARLALVLLASVPVVGCSHSRVAECSVSGCAPAVVSACEQTVQLCESLGGAGEAACVGAQFSGMQAACATVTSDTDDDSSSDKSKDKTKDETKDEAQDSDTFGDSAASSVYFAPVRASMSWELAYNASHQLSAWTVDGTTYQPTLVVQLQDRANDSCYLRYVVNIAALNTYVAGASGASFKSWLTAQGLSGGLVIDDGLYSALSSGSCNLDPASDAWTTNPHKALLKGAWRIGWASGLPAAVRSELVSGGGLDSFYGAGFDEDDAVGGYLALPDGYFATGTSKLPAAGLAGQVNGSMEVVDDGHGSFVFLDASTLCGASGPNAALIRMSSLYLITFN